MRKLLAFMLVFAFVATPLLAGSTMQTTPKVRYRYPKDEAELDLSEEENLIFTWKSSPSPAGGRSRYKFEIYKGFTYDIILKEYLKPTASKLEVPVETFKVGQLYTWQVKQRGEKSRDWSADCRWTFKVIKIDSEE